MSDVAKALRNAMQATARLASGVIFLLLLIAGSVYAQSGSGTSSTDGSTPLGLQPGSPVGSFPLSGFDNINGFNGNLNFHLPLLQIGGRGGAQHTLMLPIEQRWRIIRSDAQPFLYTPTSVRWISADPGYSPGVLVARHTGVADLNNCPGTTEALTRLNFTAADGTEYELRDVAHNGAVLENQFFCCPCQLSFTNNRGKVFVTADGSSATFISDTDIMDCVGIGIEESYPSGWLLMRDGMRYRIDGSRVTLIQDRNGNQLTFQYNFHNLKITDSLNRVVNVNFYYNSDTTPLRDEIVYTGFGGTSRTITVNYGLLESNCRSGFSKQLLSDLFPGLGAGTSQYGYYNPSVVSSMVMPNGKSYTFYYNSYGELSRVVLPTGGAYEYDYECGIAGGNASGLFNSAPQQKDIYRRVTKKRIYISGVDVNGNPLNGGGTQEALIKFSKQEDATAGNLGYVDISHYDSTGTNLLALDRHFYLGLASDTWNRQANYYSKWQDGKEWKTEVYDSDGSTWLQRVIHNWQQPLDGNTWPLGTPETNLTVRENDPQIVDTTTRLRARVAGEVDQVSFQNFLFDKYTNKTDVYEYNFGNTPNYGSLIRRTHTDYVTSNLGYNYDKVNPNTTNPDVSATIHQRSLPSRISIYDTNGIERARTTYEYDNYTDNPNDPTHKALTPRSDICQLAAQFIVTTYVPRGNVTGGTRYLLTIAGAVSGSISTYQQYDVAGNIVKTRDAKGNETQFDFADNFGTPDTEARLNSPPSELSSVNKKSYGMAGKVTNALGHVGYLQFDYYLGKPVNAEDVNGVIYKGDFRDAVGNVDALDRPRQIVRAAGTGDQSSLKSRTLISYDDTNRVVTTETDLNSYDDRAMKSEVEYDRLGRAVETRVYEPGGGIIHSVQQYDGMGRVSRTYNPDRDSMSNQTTDGRTDTTYDGASRVTQIKTYDGSGNSTGTVTTSYSANNVTLTDQAGKLRRTLTDAAGRLLRADEPDTNGNLGTITSPVQMTNYSYDALDDLTQVAQGSQARRFAYDSLKRLIYAANPEQATSASLTYNSQQWAVKYDYDDNSNLTRKTDSRVNGSGQLLQVDNAYDMLNRMTSRSYTNDPQATPAVHYYYDAQALPSGFPAGFTRGASTGKLVAVLYGSATSTTGSYQKYDLLGRVTQSFQKTDTQAYEMDYDYDLAGHLKWEKYPSGREVTTSYDSAGRITAVDGLKATVTTHYAQQMSYAAHGALSAMQLGNSKWEHTLYNSRLQPTEIGLGSSSNDSSLLKLEYKYGVVISNVLDTTKNNGNVQSQIISAPKTASGTLVLTQSYTYDSLNRLQVASETGTPSWQQTYDIDRYGNRAMRNTSYIPAVNVGLTPLSANSTDFSAFSQSTNRLSVATSPQVVYDEAGNLTRDQASRTFIYDGENRLVNYNSGAGQYVYDGGGQRVKKIDNTGTTVFVYNVAGQMIAEYTSGTANGSGTSYLTSDQLGSTRVVTKADGGVKARYDYLPYGEEIETNIGGRNNVTGYGGGNSTRQKFTAKERDTESGLDYFLARYYSSAQGRFTSVDPAIRSAVLEMPQSWNRYAYVINNPLLLTDPNGKIWVQDKKGVISWRDGEVVPVGYTRVADGTEVNNVHGATGQYERYNGHNITFNADGTVGDRGLYVPPPTIVPDLPDKSGEVGWALIQFEAVGATGACIVLSGGLTGLAILDGSALLAHAFTHPPTQDPIVAGTTRDVDAGEGTVEQALDAAEKWLGKDYQQTGPDIYRSKDGTRQFRMRTGDLTDPRQGPHVHFEYIGPDGRQIVENAHFRLRGKP